MLEAAGLIELDPNAAFNPTVDDITSYKVNITIEELKANTIPSVLPDVAAAVVNGNYALDFGLKTDEAIYKDSVLDVEEYWNLSPRAPLTSKTPTPPPSMRRSSKPSSPARRRTCSTTPSAVTSSQWAGIRT